MKLRCPFCLLALIPLTACASRPAPIQHVVFTQLKSADQTQTLLADAQDTLADIPGVASYIGGVHLDIGRTGIQSDYSAAFIIGFRNTTDYQAYLDHPAHTEFVTRWMPELEWIRIYDVAR